MNRKPSTRVIVFAKAPLAGRVKTRLTSTLSPEAAAQLHAALVEHTLNSLCAAAQCPIELWCFPNKHHDFFQHCAQRYGVTLHTQRGDDLGMRMHHAACQALERSRRVILVGTDCPSLCADDLSACAHALHDHDAVLGPAEDGGYWLLGLRRSDPRLFDDIAWGSAQVLAQTRQRFEELGWRWHEITTRWDVDRPEDLARLRSTPSLRLAIEPDL